MDAFRREFVRQNLHSVSSTPSISTFVPQNDEIDVPKNVGSVGCHLRSSLHIHSKDDPWSEDEMKSAFTLWKLFLGTNKRQRLNQTAVDVFLSGRSLESVLKLFKSQTFKRHVQNSTAVRVGSLVLEDNSPTPEDSDREDLNTSSKARLALLDQVLDSQKQQEQDDKAKTFKDVSIEKEEEEVLKRKRSQLDFFLNQSDSDVHQTSAIAELSRKRAALDCILQSS